MGDAWRGRPRNHPARQHDVENHLVGLFRPDAGFGGVARGSMQNHQVVLGEVFGRQFGQFVRRPDEKDAYSSEHLNGRRAVVQPEAAR